MVEERYDRKKMFDKKSRINAERRNLEIYDRIKNYSKILDIGCGLGYFAQLVESDPAIISYIGIDYDEESVLRATEVIDNTKFRFALMDLNKKSILDILDSSNNPDTVICTELIEHIPKESQIKLLYDIKTIMDGKEKAVFIGTTPMQPKEGPNPSGNHYHVWEHTFESFKEMVDNVFKGYSINLQRRYDYGDTIFFEVIKR